MPVSTPTPTPTPTPKRTVKCTAAKRATGRGSKRRFAITCKVSPDAKGARGTLKKGSKTVAKGTVRSGRLRFTVRRRQKAGAYTVELVIARKTTRFRVTLK